jgi:DNA-binding MarR family transcriptional regulator
MLTNAGAEEDAAGGETGDAAGGETGDAAGGETGDAAGGETGDAAGGTIGRRPAAWVLRRVNRRYGASVAAALRDAGLGELPRPGYWLLMLLASGSRDSSSLVEATGVTKQAVSKVVETLVAEGFVGRRPNGSDRRRTDLVLTAKGARTVEVIRAALRRTERAFVSEVGPQAWETTLATLAVLAEGQV